MKTKLLISLSLSVFFAGCDWFQSAPPPPKSGTPVIPSHVPGSTWEDREEPVEEETEPVDEIDALIRDLGKADWNVRDEATKKLIEMGQSVAGRLVQALQNKDSDIRKNAAWILGEIKSDDAVDPLVLLLKDIDDDVRAYAAQALGKIGSTRALVHLNRAKHDPSRDVRKMAKQAAIMVRESSRITPPPIKDEETELQTPEETMTRENGETKQEEEKKTQESIREREERVLELIEMLESPDPRSRYNAALQFAMIRDTRAVKPLVELLSDESSFVRQAAARALGEIGDKSVIDKLEMAVNDSEEMVQKAAREALEKLKK